MHIYSGYMYVYVCVCIFMPYLLYRFQTFKKYEVSHFPIGGWCLEGISITAL